MENPVAFKRQRSRSIKLFESYGAITEDVEHECRGLRDHGCRAPTHTGYVLWCGRPARNRGIDDPAAGAIKVRSTIPQIAGAYQYHFLLNVIGFFFCFIYPFEIVLGVGTCSEIYEHTIEQ
jgi:hypothetical protein